MLITDTETRLDGPGEENSQNIGTGTDYRVRQTSPRNFVLLIIIITRTIGHVRARARAENYLSPTQRDGRVRPCANSVKCVLLRCVEGAANF